DLPPCSPPNVATLNADAIARMNNSANHHAEPGEEADAPGDPSDLALGRLGDAEPDQRADDGADAADDRPADVRRARAGVDDGFDGGAETGRTGERTRGRDARRRRRGR